MTNLINDAPIVDIVTRSDQTLNVKFVDLGKDPDEKANDQQENGKIKRIEKPSDNAHKPNENIVEEPKIVEEKSGNEETPKAVNGDSPKVNDPSIVPLQQIKIPYHSHKGFRRKKTIPNSKSFLKTLATCP